MARRAACLDVKDADDQYGRRAATSAALRIAAIYLIVGAGWILLSDRVLLVWAGSPERAAELQTLKGWAYVAATGVLLFALVRGHVWRLAAAAAENARLLGAVRRQAAELEQRVAERTAKLQEANADLQAFTATVSHVLQAPMRAMAGLSQAVEAEYGDRLDEPAREELRAVSAAAARGHALVADLLEYARLTNDDLRPEPTDLGAAVHAARRKLEPTLRASGGTLRIAEPLPSVVCDPGLLVRLVGQILANAVKFVAPGVRPDVRVHAERSGDRVRLWVDDNGLGIATEQRARVFEPFERLHAPDAYEGNGIGLAIVRRGVGRMSGSCGVESAPGGGSRFWIDLPAAGDRHDPASHAA